MSISKVDSQTGPKHESGTEAVTNEFPMNIGFLSACVLIMMGIIISLSTKGNTARIIGFLSVFMAVSGSVLAYRVADILKEIHNKL